LILKTFLFSLTLCASSAALAQAPIKLLVGFPPGGGTDIIARVLAEKLKDQLGTSVIVENKAGAGGQLAAQALKAAAADGNTLFLSHDHTISILPMVVKNAGYESAKDFVPVVGVATFVNALAVSSGTPAKNYSEYIAWLKTQGDKRAVGIPAPASTPEFLVNVLGNKNAMKLQPVPYRGSAPMMADMLGNQIAAGVGSVPDFIENHKAGKVRVIAVAGAARQAAMPDVQTLSELGITEFDDVPYYGIFAPAGTPKAAIEKFSEAMKRVLAMPDVRERLTNMGLTVQHMTDEQLGGRERAYAGAWAKVIRDSGFQPQ
jgi:tripartite-type tricarboxylate transporter receptor subunit TctC